MLGGRIQVQARTDGCALDWRCPSFTARLARIFSDSGQTRRDSCGKALFKRCMSFCQSRGRQLSQSYVWCERDAIISSNWRHASHQVLSRRLPCTWRTETQLAAAQRLSVLAGLSWGRGLHGKRFPPLYISMQAWSQSAPQQTGTQTGDRGPSRSRCLSRCPAVDREGSALAHQSVLHPAVAGPSP